MVPLFGVLFLDWDTFAVVALYWFENVVLGAINVLKMITCSPQPGAIEWPETISPEQHESLDRLMSLEARIKQSPRGEALAQLQWTHFFTKFVFVPFFVLHYGLFCFVHGVFVFGLIGNRMMPDRLGVMVKKWWQVAEQEHLLWAAGALAASHLYSFFTNYLGRGEYQRTATPILMFQPYARIVVLHLAIVFGAFISLALGSNVGMLAILVVGKTIVDLGLHVRERKRNAKRPEEESSEPSPILAEVLTKPSD